MTTTVIPTKKHLLRNCGVRTKGSAYVKSTLQENDLDLRHQLICEPWPIDPGEIGLSAIGLVVVQRPGTDVYDIYDWVGRSYYTLAQFVEEATQHEISRKVDSILGPQMSLITSESKYFFVHPDAIIENFEPLYENRIGVKTCPTGIEHHDRNEKYSSCLALHWEIEGTLPKDYEDGDDMVHEVKMPITRPKGTPPEYTFDAAYPPKGYKPKTSPGIFMWMPAELLLLEIIEDDVDMKHEEIVDLLKELGSNLPYMVVEE